MLLTSPLVVTVGISLCIPLSLIGQMIINSQRSSAIYWLGAGIVFLSFIFINHESNEDQPQITPVTEESLHTFEDNPIDGLQSA